MSIGFVIQPQGVSLDTLVDAARTVHASTHVVIDEAKAVPSFQALGAQVIYRRSDDDHAHEKFDAAQFVQDMHAIAPHGALLHLGNEPGRNTLAALDAWTLTALQTCDRVGRKGVIFNFETGNPEPPDWPALSASIQYAYQHGHFVGLHEYFDVTVARSLTWHIGRFSFLQETFGAKTPRIIITELGCAVGYNPYAGWATIHTQESYARELEAAMDIYRSYGIDALVFMLGYWDRTATFDVRGQQVIFDAMAAMNSGAGEGEEMAVPGYVRVTTKQTGAVVNVRAAASISAPIVATVKTGDWAKKVGSPVKNGAYTWQPVAVDKSETSHVHGWVATEIIQF